MDETLDCLFDEWEMPEGTEEIDLDQEILSTPLSKKRFKTVGDLRTALMDAEEVYAYVRSDLKREGVYLWVLQNDGMAVNYFIGQEGERIVEHIDSITKTISRQQGFKYEGPFEEH